MPTPSGLELSSWPKWASSVQPPKLTSADQWRFLLRWAKARWTSMQDPDCRVANETAKSQHDLYELLPRPFVLSSPISTSGLGGEGLSMDSAVYSELTRLTDRAKGNQILGWVFLYLVQFAQSQCCTLIITGRQKSSAQRPKQQH